MLRLLDRLEASAAITAELTATIVLNYDTDVISFFLDQRGANLQMTEEIAWAAVYSGGKGAQRKMDLLSKRLAQANTPITIGLMVSIIEYCQETVIASLLEQRGADVPIVEAVVMAAVNMPRVEARSKMAVLLERRQQVVHEVLVRLAGVEGVKVGGYDELNARVKCDEGWIYLRRDKNSGVLSVR